MSNYCSNCGTQFNGQTKFCKKCGASLKLNNNQNEIKKNDEVNLVEDSLNQPNKSKRLFIALLVMVVLAIVFFVAKSFFIETKTLEKPFSISKQLSKIEGKWNDPTGIILGDEKTIVILKQKGEIVKGSDKNGFFDVQITPFGSNNYQAIVNLRGIKGDFELHFYEEENKLVFFSTLTKSSWYLVKMN